MSILLYIKRRYLSQRAQGVIEYTLLLLLVIVLANILLHPSIKSRYYLIFLQIVNSIKNL